MSSVMENQLYTYSKFEKKTTLEEEKKMEVQKNEGHVTQLTSVGSEPLERHGFLVVVVLILPHVVAVKRVYSALVLKSAHLKWRSSRMSYLCFHFIRSTSKSHQPITYIAAKNYSPKEESSK